MENIRNGVKYLLPMKPKQHYSLSLFSFFFFFYISNAIFMAIKKRIAYVCGGP